MSKTFARASDYPLHWPEMFPRAKKPTSSKLNTSLFNALENVKEALRKFAADSGKNVTDLTISSNYSLTDTKPKDAGVAVWFTWDGEQTCIPVDRYLLVEDNLQAIYHCIEAERTKLRHGGINLVKAAFRGYAALPDPNRVTWRDVLGYPEGNDLAEVKRLYRQLAQKHHPDRTDGNTEMFNIVQQAWDMAQAELSQ